MTIDAVCLRTIVVVGSALIYWTGVFIQVRRVRTRIGRSPNVRPRGLKEKLLWLGWVLVVIAWVGQPFLIRRCDHPFFFFIPVLAHSAGLWLGVLMMLVGYGGTLWCYASLGDTWRMGIRRREKTVLVRHGPYRYVRHPIYLFQIAMLLGVFFLLPTPFSILMVATHLVCVLIKARDEEVHLLQSLGSQYRDYLSETGRLLPRWKRRVIKAPGD